MSGRLGIYRELVGEARKKRLDITRSQEKELRALYDEIAKGLESSLKRYSPQTLTYRWLGDYAKALRRESKTLYQTVEKKVSSSVLETAGAVAEAEQEILCQSVSCSVATIFRCVFQYSGENCRRIDERRYLSEFFRIIGAHLAV